MTGRKALICALILTAGLMLPFLGHEAQAVQSTTLKTNGVGDLTPNFVTPGTRYVALMSFALRDSASEQLTQAVVDYTGTNVSDISSVMIFAELAGGGFNVAQDMFLAAASNPVGRLFTLNFTFNLQSNVKQEFYIVVNVSGDAVDDDSIDARINADAMTAGGKTWPDQAYEPGGEARVESSPPAGWANFTPTGWQRLQRQNCSVSVKDTKSGLQIDTARYRYSTDGGGNWSAWMIASCTGITGTVALETITAFNVSFGKDSGTDNLISFCITDVVGNIGNSTPYIVKIDSTGPVNWALLSPLDWYAADTRPNVTVSVQDLASGLNISAVSAEYSRDGGANWTPAPSVNSSLVAPGDPSQSNVTAWAVPFDNDSETLNHVRFNASDNVGNWNISPPYIIKIDSTPPEKPLMAGLPAYTRSVSTTVSWVAVPDPVSDSPKYFLEYDDEPGFSDPPGKLKLGNVTSIEVGNLTDGKKYYFHVAQEDRVGHRSKFSEPVNTTIDISPPFTTAAVSPAAPNGDNGWYTVAVVVNFSAGDNTSGVASTRYTVNSGNVTNGTSLELSSDGEYRVDYWSEDMVGNVEYAGSVNVKIDMTPPVPVLSPPAVIYINETASFDGSCSTDAVEYLWEFGDYSATASGASVNHMFTLQGPYTVTLTVKDRAGLTCSTSDNVMVYTHNNTPPEAKIVSLSSTKINATTGHSDPVTFDGSQSTDEDRATLTYAWDFGDGTVGSGMIVSHTYSKEGPYEVELKVTDSGTLYDIAKWSIMVYREGDVNKQPVAKIDMEGANAFANEPVWLNASRSIDEDLANCTFTWDFDDGSKGSGIRVFHVYTNTIATVYIVRLNVTDSLGLSGNAELSIGVFIEGYNQEPIVQFTFSPNWPNVTEVVYFDGSLTMDEEPSTLSYTWDFGDGSGAQGKLVNHTFTKAGDYEVKLRVWDRHGRMNSSTYHLTVANGPIPPPPPVNETAAWVYWAAAGGVAAAVAVPLGLYAVTRRRKKEEPVPEEQRSHGVEGPVSLVSAAPGEETQPLIVVDRGINYLLDADHPAIAYEALERLTAEGAKALIFTPIHPKKVLKMADLKNVQMFWLSDLFGDEPTMDPAKMEYEMSETIIAFIKKHKEEGVVFIDGLDLLIQRHGYDKALDFIQGVNELASVNEATVLVNVHSKAMKEVEFNQLKRKFDRW